MTALIDRPILKNVHFLLLHLHFKRSRQIQGGTTFSRKRYCFEKPKLQQKHWKLFFVRFFNKGGHLDQNPCSLLYSCMPFTCHLLEVSSTRLGFLILPITFKDDLVWSNHHWCAIFNGSFHPSLERTRYQNNPVHSQLWPTHKSKAIELDIFLEHGARVWRK